VTAAEPSADADVTDDATFSDIDPDLISRRVLLRPVLASDYEYLYQLSLSPPNLTLWRYRGATPSPDRFVESLWTDVLAQFVLIDTRELRPIGLVYCYQPDFRNGHAHLALIMEEISNRPVVAFDAMVLFVNYVFSNWPFRNLYGEQLALNFDRFASAEGRVFVEEGRMRAHEFHAGKYWDVIISALYREDWAPIAARHLPRIRRSIREVLPTP